MQRSVLPVRIVGTGEYLPERVVTSIEFDHRWQKAEGWTERLSGVQSRRFANATETSSWMGAAAARMALANAHLEPTQIDCVISACSVMEQAIPCSGVLIQRHLGLEATRIPAFDVNATCLSFLVALDLASCAIAIGRYRRVLIVSSEIASSGINFDDFESAALFGDGAGAVVLERGDEAAILAAHFESYTEGAELCQVKSGGTRLRPDRDEQAWRDGAKFAMNGRATYRLAAQKLPGFLDRLWTRAEIDPRNITCIVPHQASGKALSHLREALQLPHEQLVDVLATRGNQIAASVPCALHVAIRDGRVQRGGSIALVGSGAGVSFGGIVLSY